MGPGEPERDHVERYEWLWEKPFDSFYGYAPDLGATRANNAWFESWPRPHTDSLYGVHCRALQGDTFALAEMQAFRLALITLRLKS